MDICGRKYPITIGMFVAGVFLALIPFFKEVYPGFFICRAMISVGTILFVNVPLLADYVQYDSIGLAMSLSATIMAINSFLTGSVMLTIA